MENIIKILLGEASLKEIGNATLEDTIRIETERLDEKIPIAEDVVKSFETVPSGTEMRRGCELILAYMGKYLKPQMTYREFYQQLKESEQLALSESVYNVIEEIKNMFSPAQA